MDPSSYQLPVRMLVVLGVVVHLLLVASIFDIHFQTPVVRGLDPVWPTMEAPAQRLVIFVADGLRADKFFEIGAQRHRAGEAFLHTIARERGRWGVSHARPPTESRPGHVAILGGFYEDPSAITKGWQANPVEFDHILNRSSAAWGIGSPDIVPLFTKGIAHASGAMYSVELQDFSSAALAQLDVWAFDRLEDLLRRAGLSAPPADPLDSDDPWRDLPVGTELDHRLRQSGVVIFLHLLGLDSNGHAYRPSSEEYLANIAIVDEGVARTERLVQEFFGDNKTAFIFTADHGMSNKGSHGDGSPDNTETPLLSWGAGSDHHPISDREAGFHQHVDGCPARGPTPPEWLLDHAMRMDVDQADIAPLAASLLGRPIPLNSVGLLPTAYLNLPLPAMAEAMLANARQLLAQVARKAEVAATSCISSALHFAPYSPLANSTEQLLQTRDLLQSGVLTRLPERGATSHHGASSNPLSPAPSPAPDVRLPCVHRT
ncbi:hypothetical protein CYMTET_25736 [Cymbomonas tetramitiformis]|uniref:GPI ethanolamine phosphate transferase 1 n=1 Tax=Cymbomonas tetramitiformis TaxID=36881 RepID=A0AAE0KYL5_9CHLO|nr:hypothetical protein CYMTET_25736 [Cymbomonas tetramitiformis]